MTGCDSIVYAMMQDTAVQPRGVKWERFIYVWVWNAHRPIVHYVVVHLSHART